MAALACLSKGFLAAGIVRVAGLWPTSGTFSVPKGEEAGPELEPQVRDRSFFPGQVGSGISEERGCPSAVLHSGPKDKRIKT